ncbi:MAG: hypothetical protein ACLQVY_17040 [Limisphaerales bacterium]
MILASRALFLVLRLDALPVGTIILVVIYFTVFWGIFGRIRVIRAYFWHVEKRAKPQSYCRVKYHPRIQSVTEISIRKIEQNSMAAKISLRAFSPPAALDVPGVGLRVLLVGVPVGGVFCGKDLIVDDQQILRVIERKHEN